MSNKNGYLTRFFSFSEWLKYLDNFDANIINVNLKNLKYLAKKLGVFNLNAFIFIVGGTNGKGTTCYVLEQLLLSLGYRVGLYTSPHLIHYTERVRVNGMELDKSLHVSSFNIIEKVRDLIVLTRFEFITLSALLLFKNFKLDIIILEVGLGGRLDATNIIHSDISIITSIDLDHTDILGSTRKLISIEKTGIFRYRKISILAEENIPTIVFDIANYKKVILKIINRDWAYKKFKTHWNFTNDKLSLINLPIPKVALNNVATAVSAIIESGIIINSNDVRNCIIDLVFPGRCQIISYNPIVILDVAHNRHAVKYLLNKIITLKRLGKVYAIVGVLKHKDIDSIVSPLKSIIDFWFCVTLKTNRSLTAEQIKNYLFINSKICVNMLAAWKEIQNIIENQDIIVIFGSFFAIREAYSLFKNKLISV